MQQIFVEEPYKFIPPYEGTFYANTLHLWAPWYLNKTHGVASHEVRGVGHLKAGIEAGHSILLAPNHSRYSDPMAMSFVNRAVRLPCFTMASWHLFKVSGAFSRGLMRRLGGFSVYREGPDRESLRLAIDILAANRRPLILFPEGIVTHANDRLADLQEGVSFIARSAAKKRAETDPSKKVLIYPVALKYFFRGDLTATVTPILEEFERRLTWPPQRHLSLVQRIYKIGEALLSLKEVEYLGRAQGGPIRERLANMIEAVLGPHERRIAGGRREPTLIGRIKKLRSIAMAELVAAASGKGPALTEEGRAERWKVLADTYLAQQLSSYPSDYLRVKPTVERILETVERLDEDFNDNARVLRPLHLVAEVGEPIEVPAGRPPRDEAGDPVMAEFRKRLQGMLDRLSDESALGEPGPVAVPFPAVPVPATAAAAAAASSVASAGSLNAATA